MLRHAPTQAAARERPTESFTCRSRTMRLTADQASLALSGRIAATLRQRSPVYYWRTTDQNQSRHEAVCTKKGRWVVITFGSHGRFQALAARSCSRIRLTPSIDECTAHSLETLPAEWREAHGANASSPGAGWWRWKAFLILRTLRSLAVGDVVAHLDYDLVPDRDLSSLLCLGQNAARGVAVFHTPCLTEHGWTKRELAVAMNATDLMLSTAQIYAGLIAIRKGASSMRFVREWLRWSYTDLVTDTADTPQLAVFVRHRHDQSILSLLSKRHGIKSFPFPTKGHDVRDIWAWDAGYCERGFRWPLPSFQSSQAFRYGFVTHFKEMGHQHDSTWICRKLQGRAAPLPLPDYLESDEVLQELHHGERVARASKRGRWWNVTAGRGTVLRLPQVRVGLLLQPKPLAAGRKDRVRRTDLSGVGRCIANLTFGAFEHEGRPLMWVSQGCRGVFRCSGIAMACGRAGRAGQRFIVCPCHVLNSLEYSRHWNDGQLSGLARQIADAGSGEGRLVVDS